MSAGANNSKAANPLLPLVLQLLREMPAGISEYDLLKKIEAAGDYFSTAEVAHANDAQLVLFRKHFLVMNALYRLQEILWRDERLWLSISPLRIALESCADDSSSDFARGIAQHGDDALRDYYLDWERFIGTDGDAVAELLAAFWTRYAGRDRRAEALAVLQLDIDLQLDSAAARDAVKRQYRRLAAATHPDRGGDAAQFLAIRAAYEILREL